MNIRKLIGVALACLATPLIVATPAAAHHGGPHPICQNEPDLGDAHFITSHNGHADLQVIHILSAREVFNVATSVSFNNQNSPSTLTTSATATSSKTFTVTTSVTTTMTNEESVSRLKDGLTRAGKITQSRAETLTSTVTTMTGSSTTVGVTVQPWGRLRMDRGVQAIETVFNLDTWELGQGKCWYESWRSPHNVLANIPTTDDGWRPVTWPIISQGGVVDAATYSSANIHTNSILAIFGPIFFPGTDRVLVRQGGNQFTIQAGSPWWYDGQYQINASLPPGLQPGPATVNVISRPVDLNEDVEDLQSNTISINILA